MGFVTLLAQPPIAGAAEPAAKTISLAEAFAQAQLHAPEIDAARQRIVTAEINVGRAWALLKPTWNATLRYTHTEPQPEERPPIRYPIIDEALSKVCNREGETFDGTKCFEGFLDALGEPGEFSIDFARGDNLTLNSQVQWTPLNGRAIPAIRNANDAVDLERRRLWSVEQSHRLAVARAYYAAVATQDAIAAAARANRRAGERLESDRRRAALGSQSSAAVTAAEIAVAQAELDVARARNTHAQSLLGLAFIVGLDEPKDVVAPPPPRPPAGDDATLTIQAWAHRDDIIANRIAVVIAERTKDDAWWKFAPTIGLFTAIRHSNVAGIADQNFSWTVGLAANLVLYDAGLRYQDLAAADASIRTANIALERSRAGLRRDLARSRLRIEAADIAKARANETLRLANERVTITEAQIETGTGRAIDLNEAYDRVADAERLLIRAGLDRALAVLELQHATGVLTAD